MKALEVACSRPYLPDMKQLLFILGILAPSLGLAFESAPDAADLAAMSKADIVIVGETHDNPDHHALQAQIVAAIESTSLVVEMLTPDEVSELEADKQGFSAAWEDAGWPDYAMYLPIFMALDGPIYGAAVTREVAKASYSDGVAAHFDGDTALFGLDMPLPKEQQDQRLELQFSAHCEAIPRIALGGMIEVQRLRDATLAREALQALKDNGAPVVVITGNGHARRDWGVPAMLEKARPDLRSISIGQAESGVPPEGGFDFIYDAPRVDRPDPCAAFE